jgi:hypothetical protein
MAGIAAVVALVMACISLMLFAHATFDMPADAETRRDLRRFGIVAAVIATIAIYVALLW